MKRYIEAFCAYIKKREQCENYPQMESVMGALCYCYCVHRDFSTEQIRNSFQQINEITKKLTLEENDRVCDLTCQLCDLYQQEAFQEGLRVGFRLFQELSMQEQPHSESV